MYVGCADDAAASRASSGHPQPRLSLKEPQLPLQGPRQQIHVSIVQCHVFSGRNITDFERSVEAKLVFVFCMLFNEFLVLNC